MMFQQVLLYSPTPGLKKTAERLVQSFKWLSNTIVLMLFVLSILALIGTQFFMGVLKHVCVEYPSLVLMDQLTTGPPQHNVTEKWAAKDSGNFDFQEIITNPGMIMARVFRCPEVSRCIKVHLYFQVFFCFVFKSDCGNKVNTSFDVDVVSHSSRKW